jgi:hypothetical protein
MKERGIIIVGSGNTGKIAEDIAKRMDVILPYKKPTDLDEFYLEIIAIKEFTPPPTRAERRKKERQLKKKS